MYISNLSPLEYIRVNDIQDEVIIKWAESHEKLERLESNIIDSVQEASGQYPEEDSLSDIIKLVEQLNVKGTNNILKEKIIDLLYDKQNEQNQASEYGREKLSEIMS